MLNVAGLSFSYGKVPILHELNFAVQQREITSIIGSSIWPPTKSPFEG
jgi:ABC-type branched-subunit amino acid transport system ATPase component